EDGYPYSDGHFEMEGDFHSGPLRAVLDALRAVFDGRDDMYFASDMGLFFEKGNRRAVVVPDLVFVFVAARRSRNSLKLWEEPKSPDFVMEVISEDSLRNDMEYKPPLYAALGVTEYWTFDLLGRIPTPIIARRLNDDGRYEAIPQASDGSYHSDVLGFDLRTDPSGLGVRDAATGESVFDPGTLARLRRAAQTRAERAESRADDAEARAVTEKARADTAEARADTAEARVAELEALLRQSRRR
ncbi:MAG: Uma2 family endonuclease, partial [Gammaproteobacteria bacterium]|nr:Uma2 family endonuclease [Gammaproteobacteria bacterium]